jgi:hypothetical protein
MQLWPELRLASLPANLSWSTFYSHKAMLVFVAWFFGLSLMHVVLPGRRAEGVVLPNGKRLTYKLNGACSPSHTCSACPSPRSLHSRWEPKLPSTGHRIAWQCSHRGKRP